MLGSRLGVAGFIRHGWLVA